MRFILSIIIFLIANSLLAQVPQGMNYQVVARDKDGAPLLNQKVSFKFSVLDGSENGTLEYSEKHSCTTNSFGLVTLIIGQGTALTNTFSSINWASGQKFLTVEIDPKGGSNFTIKSASQLLSVPYALFAGNSSSSPFSVKGNNLYYNKGNIGLGTSDPVFPLHIVTDIGGGGVLVKNTHPQSSAVLSMQGGLVDEDYWIVGAQPDAGETPKGFTIGSFNTTTLAKGKFFNLTKDGYLGLGTTIPVEPLHIATNTSGSSGLFIQNSGANSTASVSLQGGDYSNVKWVIGAQPNSGSVPQGLTIGTSNGNNNGVNNLINITSNGNLGLGTTNPLHPIHIITNIGGGGVIIKNTHPESSAVVSLQGGGIDDKYWLLAGQPDKGLNPRGLTFELYDPTTFEKLKAVNITNTGNLGIGITPRAKLHVADGDIYIDDASKGVIMTSPNGQCWRMTVNDSGQPVFTAVTCP
jgi:hypothetical protein